MRVTLLTISKTWKWVGFCMAKLGRDQDPPTSLLQKSGSLRPRFGGSFQSPECEFCWPICELTMTFIILKLWSKHYPQFCGSCFWLAMCQMRILKASQQIADWPVCKILTDEKTHILDNRNKILNSVCKDCLYLKSVIAWTLH